MRRRQLHSSTKEDRISKLPEDLIHHILSFLDMKYVVQTSVLSSRWRYLWTSITTLNFDSSIFFGDDTDHIRFINFVYWVFGGISDIQRFHLVWPNAECGAICAHLDTWILAALQLNVQELSVLFSYADSVIHEIDLPHCLFNCESLTKLVLVMGGMESSYIYLPESMCLPQLNYLWLGSLSFLDKTLSELLTSCPVLESLIITDSDIKTDVDGCSNIYSLKLKHFEISNCGHDCSVRSTLAESIKVYAPNLTSFVCKDYMVQTYSLENLSSLVTADIDMTIEEEEDVDENTRRFLELSAKNKEVDATSMMKFLRELHNVKELRLSPGFLEVITESPDLEIQPPQFSNLQCLKLETWFTRGCLRAITYLLKISPNIESLFLTSAKSKLADIEDDWEAGLLLPCMLSHLKFVEIREVEGCPNELKFLEFLLKNAMVLEQVFLYGSRADSPDRVRKMKEFSKKLLCISKSFFKCHNIVLLILVGDIREVTSSFFLVFFCDS